MMLPREEQHGKPKAAKPSSADATPMYATGVAVDWSTTADCVMIGNGPESTTVFQISAPVCLLTANTDAEAKMFWEYAAWSPRISSLPTMAGVLRAQSPGMPVYSEIWCCQ